MDKIQQRVIIKYLENNGLATKDIHFDMVTTLEDFAPDLSIMKWATEFGSPMS